MIFCGFGYGKICKNGFGFKSEEVGNDITMDKTTDLKGCMDMLGEDLAVFPEDGNNSEFDSSVDQVIIKEGNEDLGRTEMEE